MTTPRAEAVLEGLRQAIAAELPALTIGIDDHAAYERAVQVEAARLWGCEPDEVQVHYDSEGRLLQVRFPPEKTIIVLTIKPVKETP